MKAMRYKHRWPLRSDLIMLYIPDHPMMTFEVVCTILFDDVPHFNRGVASTSHHQGGGGVKGHTGHRAGVDGLIKEQF